MCCWAEIGITVLNINETALFDFSGFSYSNLLWNSSHDDKLISAVAVRIIDTKSIWQILFRKFAIFMIEKAIQKLIICIFNSP